MKNSAQALRRQTGFTLVELVIVIVIMGVIGGVVAVFMRAPIQAYLDSGRRATLTDSADTAVRRISRDIRKALPNSVRVSTSGADTCLEFIPTRNGARYRENNRPTSDTVGKGLDFTTADSHFNMLGRNADWPADQRIGINDLVVVYNLGITNVTAYNGDNVARVASLSSDATSGAEETTIELAAPKQFPLESGTKRFHVVPVEENVVAYVCNGSTLRRLVTPGVTTGTGVLFTNSATRYCGSAGNPVGAAPVLISDLSACSFTYNDTDSQRNGLVQMSLSITRNAETVNLYHQIQVNNTP